MTPHPGRMPLRDALVVLRDLRRDDEIVVAAMGAAREWMALSAHALDWIHVPSSMGQAPSLGLGLALALPKRRVLVLNGDGSLLMNLGCLVTITSLRPPNLVLVTLDNGVYEVTGAQPTPASAAGRTTGVAVDFAALASASGFEAVARFSEVDAWRRGARVALDQPGPSFVVLDVAPVPGARGPRSPGPPVARAREFMRRLVEDGGGG
ncbi:MAG TPA: thiamine pyrophosphate-dependent enzyme [Gemmatimonadales bacterium]|nr:thiamine pyrophosphate-dependent enzyme [Gemmatimonadales bacterium]